MFDFSPIQLVIVLVIALVIMGPKRVPEMARSLGRGMREFRSSITNDNDDDVDITAVDTIDDETPVVTTTVITPGERIAA